MPSPGVNETQADFVSRCIPIVLEDTAKDQKQAAAICYSIWRDKHKDEELFMGDASGDMVAMDRQSVTAQDLAILEEELMKRP